MAGTGEGSATGSSDRPITMPPNVRAGQVIGLVEVTGGL